MKHLYVHGFVSGNFAAIRLTLPTPAPFKLEWRGEPNIWDEAELRTTWLPIIERDLSARMAATVRLAIDQDDWR
jgi:hypothetical protein